MYLCTYKCLYTQMCPLCIHTHTQTHIHTYIKFTLSHKHTNKQTVTCAHTAPPSVAYHWREVEGGKVSFHLVVVLIGCPQRPPCVCVCECVTVCMPFYMRVNLLSPQSETGEGRKEKKKKSSLTSLV